MAAHLDRLIWLVAVLTCAARVTSAATTQVGPGQHCTTLACAFASASAGDTVLVGPGVYAEHGLLIDRPLVVLGVGAPVIDAHDRGEIITVTASGVTVSGLTLRNVGTSFIEDRAAIRLRGVTSALVCDNIIDNAFFGIYAEKSSGLVISRNSLQGPATREATTGNGIHLWYCTDARIEGNTIRGHRDGIYFEFVERSVVTGNVSTNNLRYGLHFMFSHEDSYFDNRFAENGAGVAVMYTHDVVMRGNLFEHNWGSSSFGLLLKDIRDSEIRGNRFVRNTVALYAEGSDRLVVEANEFVDNGYAVRIMANSMQNNFARNNFRGNAFDVVTNSRQNFSTFDGNYWSEYRGYDLDGDGVGDVPHHPVRLFSLLVEKAPPGIVLMGSLFVTMIDTAERAMPVFTPETLVDIHPSVDPVVNPSPEGASR